MSPDTKQAAPSDVLEPDTSELSKLERKRLRKANHKQVVDLTVGKASVRYLRMTPMKVRRVVDLIRGLDTADAVNTLKFAPQAAALPVRKVVESAVASLVSKRDQAGLWTDQEGLYVAEAYVDEGPTMKRFRPRARGSAGRILKRTSHITVVIRQHEDAVGAPPPRGARRVVDRVAGRIGQRRTKAPTGSTKKQADKKGRTR
jgi:large subunit ribosomal protein L22